MIAGRWFVTPHAVAQFRRRVEPYFDYHQALDELTRISETAHRVKEIKVGMDLYRTGKPRRLRLIVSRRGPGLPALVTVLKGCDHR